jgi:hypothetical protein
MRARLIRALDGCITSLNSEVISTEVPEGDLKVMAHDGSMKNEDTGSEAVYGHKMRDEVDHFHIGSGSEQRARSLNGRSNLWQHYVDTHGGSKHIEVVILERYHCPARARLREMELIAVHQSPTNTFGRSSIPAGILDGRPKGSKIRCACGAPDCYGAEVTARRR